MTSLVTETPAAYEAPSMEVVALAEDAVRCSVVFEETDGSTWTGYY